MPRWCSWPNPKTKTKAFTGFQPSDKHSERGGTEALNHNDHHSSQKQTAFSRLKIKNTRWSYFAPVLQAWLLQCQTGGDIWRTNPIITKLCCARIYISCLYCKAVFCGLIQILSKDAFSYFPSVSWTVEYLIHWSWYRYRCWNRFICWRLFIFSIRIMDGRTANTWYWSQKEERTQSVFANNNWCKFSVTQFVFLRIHDICEFMILDA